VTARDYLSPLALAEHRYPASIGINAVDVCLVRADHPVDMDKTLVAALRCDLFGRQFAPIVSSTLFRTSSPRDALASTMRPSSNRTVHLKLSETLSAATTILLPTSSS